MILYHGTSKSTGEKILKEGFKPNKTYKYNWKVKSKRGFVYLSLAYAPFYAMAVTKSGEDKGMLIKVKVNEEDLYPDDNFMMHALGKQICSKTELDKIKLEDFKDFAPLSLKYMGNACAKSEDIKIIGGTSFDIIRLIHVCDPTVTPLNYRVMGDFYKKLSRAIYFEKLKYEQDYIKFWYTNFSQNKKRKRDGGIDGRKIN